MSPARRCGARYNHGVSSSSIYCVYCVYYALSIRVRSFIWVHRSIGLLGVYVICWGWRQVWSTGSQAAAAWPARWCNSDALLMLKIGIVFTHLWNMYSRS